MYTGTWMKTLKFYDAIYIHRAALEILTNKIVSASLQRIQIADSCDLLYNYPQQVWTDSRVTGL